MTVYLLGVATLQATLAASSASAMVHRSARMSICRDMPVRDAVLLATRAQCVYLPLCIRDIH